MPKPISHPDRPDLYKWCGRGMHFELRTVFSKNKTASDGLQSVCKGCMKGVLRNARDKRAHAGDEISATASRLLTGLSDKQFQHVFFGL